MSTIIHQKHEEKGKEEVGKEAAKMKEKEIANMTEKDTAKETNQEKTEEDQRVHIWFKMLVPVKFRSFMISLWTVISSKPFS